VRSTLLEAKVIPADLHNFVPRVIQGVFDAIVDIPNHQMDASAPLAKTVAVSVAGFD
jgi:hypothetical protein